MMGTSVHNFIAGVLLALGVVIELICCVGVVAARRALDKAHYLGPATFLGPLLIAAALIVDKSSLQSCIKGVMVFVGLTVMGPVINHAIGRAIAVNSREIELQPQGPGAR